MFNSLWDRRTEHSLELGEAEPGWVPSWLWEKKNQTVAVSLPVMDGKWWGPNWLWPLGTALTSAIGDKKKVPAGSLPDK